LTIGRLISIRLEFIDAMRPRADGEIMRSHKPETEFSCALHMRHVQSEWFVCMAAFVWLVAGLLLKQQVVFL
jgi:hypothetical protein